MVFIPVKNEKIKETLGPEQMVNSGDLECIYGISTKDSQKKQIDI